MANNLIQDGDVLNLAPSASVASGGGHQFGAALFGVALTDATPGVPSAFMTEGVWTLPKTSALAIAVGDRVYWDVTNGVVNKTATGQLCVGVAVQAAANPSATVAVKLGAYLATAA